MTSNEPTNIQNNNDHSWKRPWTLNEIIQSSKKWSLAADAGVCELLKKMSTELINDVNLVNVGLSEYSLDTKETSVLIQNTFNDLCMLANDQFMESLVRDACTEVVAAADRDSQLPVSEDRLKVAERQVSTALGLGMQVLDRQFEMLDVARLGRQSEATDPVSVLTESIRDTELAPALDLTSANEPIYHPRDPYEQRHLPHLIGTQAFIEDDSLGIGYIDEQEEEEEEEEDLDESAGRHGHTGTGLSHRVDSLSSLSDGDNDLDPALLHVSIPQTRPQHQLSDDGGMFSSSDEDPFAEIISQQTQKQQQHQPSSALDSVTSNRSQNSSVSQSSVPLPAARTAPMTLADKLHDSLVHKLLDGTPASLSNSFKKPPASKMPPPRIQPVQGPESDSDDMFEDKSAKRGIPSTKSDSVKEAISQPKSFATAKEPSSSQQVPKKKISALFSDDEDEDNNLFANVISTKESKQSIQKNSDKKPNLTPSGTVKTTLKSLFLDDDDDDDDAKLFTAPPATIVQLPTKNATPAPIKRAKQAQSGSDSDDIFNEKSSKKTEPIAVVDVSIKDSPKLVGVKVSKTRDKAAKLLLLESDDDEDLFKPNPYTTKTSVAAIVQVPQSVQSVTAAENSEDSEDSSESRPTMKKLPAGAKSIFPTGGGVKNSSLLDEMKGQRLSHHVGSVAMVQDEPQKHDDTTKDPLFGVSSNRTPQDQYIETTSSPFSSDTNKMESTPATHSQESEEKNSLLSSSFSKKPPQARPSVASRRQESEDDDTLFSTTKKETQTRPSVAPRRQESEDDDPLFSTTKKETQTRPSVAPRQDSEEDDSLFSTTKKEPQALPSVAPRRQEYEDDGPLFSTTKKETQDRPSVAPRRQESEDDDPLFSTTKKETQTRPSVAPRQDSEEDDFLFSTTKKEHQARPSVFPRRQESKDDDPLFSTTKKKPQARPSVAPRQDSEDDDPIFSTTKKEPQARPSVAPRQVSEDDDPIFSTTKKEPQARPSVVPRRQESEDDDPLFSTTKKEHQTQPSVAPRRQESEDDGPLFSTTKKETQARPSLAPYLEESIMVSDQWQSQKQVLIPKSDHDTSSASILIPFHNEDHSIMESPSSSTFQGLNSIGFQTSHLVAGTNRNAVTSPQDRATDLDSPLKDAQPRLSFLTKARAKTGPKRRPTMSRSRKSVADTNNAPTDTKTTATEGRSIGHLIFSSRKPRENIVMQCGPSGKKGDLSADRSIYGLIKTHKSDKSVTVGTGQKRCVYREESCSNSKARMNASGSINNQQQRQQNEVDLRQKMLQRLSGVGERSHKKYEDRGGDAVETEPSGSGEVRLFIKELSTEPVWSSVFGASFRSERHIPLSVRVRPQSKIKRTVSTSASGPVAHRSKRRVAVQTSAAHRGTGVPLCAVLHHADTQTNIGDCSETAWRLLLLHCVYFLTDSVLATVVAEVLKPKPCCEEDACQTYDISLDLDVVHVAVNTTAHCFLEEEENQSIDGLIYPHMNIGLGENKWQQEGQIYHHFISGMREQQQPIEKLIETYLNTEMREKEQEGVIDLYENTGMGEMEQEQKGLIDRHDNTKVGEDQRPTDNLIETFLNTEMREKEQLTTDELICPHLNTGRGEKRRKQEGLINPYEYTEVGEEHCPTDNPIETYLNAGMGEKEWGHEGLIDSHSNTEMEQKREELIDPHKNIEVREEREPTNNLINTYLNTRDGKEISQNGMSVSIKIPSIKVESCISQKNYDEDMDESEDSESCQMYKTTLNLGRPKTFQTNLDIMANKIIKDNIDLETTSTFQISLEPTSTTDDTVSGHMFRAEQIGDLALVSLESLCCARLQPDNSERIWPEHTAMTLTSGLPRGLNIPEHDEHIHETSEYIDTAGVTSSQTMPIQGTSCKSDDGQDSNRPIRDPSFKTSIEYSTPNCLEDCVRDETTQTLVRNLNSASSKSSESEMTKAVREDTVGSVLIGCELVVQCLRDVVRTGTQLETASCRSEIYYRSSEGVGARATAIIDGAEVRTVVVVSGCLTEEQAMVRARVGHRVLLLAASWVSRRTKSHMELASSPHSPGCCHALLDSVVEVDEPSCVLPPRLTCNLGPYAATAAATCCSVAATMIQVCTESWHSIFAGAATTTTPIAAALCTLASSLLPESPASHSLVALHCSRARTVPVAAMAAFLFPPHTEDPVTTTNASRSITPGLVFLYHAWVHPTLSLSSRPLTSLCLRTPTSLQLRRRPLSRYFHCHTLKSAIATALTVPPRSSCSSSLSSDAAFHTLYLPMQSVSPSPPPSPPLLPDHCLDCGNQTSTTEIKHDNCCNRWCHYASSSLDPCQGDSLRRVVNEPMHSKTNIDRTTSPIIFHNDTRQHRGTSPWQVDTRHATTSPPPPHLKTVDRPPPHQSPAVCSLRASSRGEDEPQRLLLMHSISTTDQCVMEEEPLQSSNSSWPRSPTRATVLQCGGSLSSSLNRHPHSQLQRKRGNSSAATISDSVSSDSSNEFSYQYRWRPLSLLGRTAVRATAASTTAATDDACPRHDTEPSHTFEGLQTVVRTLMATAPSTMCDWDQDDRSYSSMLADIICSFLQHQ